MVDSDPGGPVKEPVQNRKQFNPASAHTFPHISGVLPPTVPPEGGGGPWPSRGKIWPDGWAGNNGEASGPFEAMEGEEIGEPLPANLPVHHPTFGDGAFLSRLPPAPPDGGLADATQLVPVPEPVTSGWNGWGGVAVDSDWQREEGRAMDVLVDQVLGQV